MGFPAEGMHAGKNRTPLLPAVGILLFGPTGIFQFISRVAPHNQRKYLVIYIIYDTSLSNRCCSGRVVRGRRRAAGRERGRGFEARGASEGDRVRDED